MPGSTMATLTLNGFNSCAKASLIASRANLLAEYAPNGLIDRAISRNVDDTNMIYVTFAVSDMAKAKKYMKDPALKKLMTKAGVISEPIFDFFTNVE